MRNVSRNRYLITNRVYMVNKDRNTDSNVRRESRKHVYSIQEMFNTSASVGQRKVVPLLAFLNPVEEGLPSSGLHPQRRETHRP
jgi:hypothetical protein